MFLLLWSVLRLFYIIGLLLVAPLLLAAIANGTSRDPGFTVPVILFSAAYFVLGYIWIGWIPKRLKTRLMARIQANKDYEFTPLAQATEYLFNRAIALDPKHRKLLYIDMQSGTEELLKYEDIRGWELVSRGNKTASLTFATDSLSNPTIGLKLPSNQVDSFSVWLKTIK